ncbi:unnamed protein product [Echinostoma caproni]|uniref:Uncharacterized protein n=1 Tax=Echinostoma caproni TaxID=27848 RepID=A0A183B1H5_9TREM|nr:unnamed protein product [Echinostoma caproni]
MGLHLPKLAARSVDGTTTSQSRSTGSNDILTSSDEASKASALWTHHSSPVPFRLTPHLAGFVCLPGAPANVGPFAISLTTVAQALAAAQRPSHVLTSLYRTLLRADYILWHRGRQAAVHAFQLLLGAENETPAQLESDSSDSDSDTETGGCKRKTKLFNELGVKAVDSVRSDKTGSVGPAQSTSQQHQQQQQQQQQTNVVQHQKSKDCVLLPDLTNEQLIQLITLTLDAMNANLKSVSDYSGAEPGTWSSIAAATNPSNLIQMDPAHLPWV